MRLKIVIYPDETGGYVAECPALPGCVSQGQTLAEIRHNIKEAIQDCLEVLNERANRERRRHKESQLISISA